MSTLRVDNITDTSGGSSSLSVPGAAKAWVNFNGTSTVAILAQLNVSSITDNGTGDYTVNFTTALTDANYAVTMTAQSYDGIGGYGFNSARLTTSVGINTRSGTNTQVDRSSVSVAIFR